MRRSSIALVAFFLFILVWILGQSFSIPGLDNLGLMAPLAVVFVLAYFYLRFEEGNADTKTIAMVGMMAALSAAGRVLMAPIPNVQPSTFIVIVTGYVFGPLPGFMVGSTTALVSNFLLGHGPWTIWQMLAWGVAGLTAGFLGKGKHLEGRWRLSFFCASWGFIYGWVLTFYFVLGFIRPLTYRAFLTAYATGLWFDVFHAAGNFAFAFLLGPALVTMLRRYRSRFQFEYAGGYTRGPEAGLREEQP